ncbi:MAG TPA: thiamine pyrophosphate-dependent enzyme [Candidatus Paceibacterota bacterium]
MKTNFGFLTEMRWILFERVLKTIETAQTGHIGACCSSLDLMTVLYFGDILRYDSANPRHPLRDYVLNRGHLGPLKYNIFNLLGWMEQEEMSQYRQYGSRLAGHEDMKLTPGVDITPNGSLGMTLSYAVGAAIGWQDAEMENRVFCFLGDGEEQEGNVSEAARHAAHLGLRGIIAVIDRNGGQLSTRLPTTDSRVDLHKLWEGYGWQVIDLQDGHDLIQIHDAYIRACEACENGPVVIIAKTIKGNGIPGCQDDYCGFHVFHNSEPGETVKVIDLNGAFNSIPQEYKGLVNPDLPVKRLPPFIGGSKDATIKVKIAKDKEVTIQYDVELNIILELERLLGDRLYVLTSDYPPRAFVYGSGNVLLKTSHYYNVGLREQHMTAMIQGLSTVRNDALVVVLCGDAFIYRHMDQINMLAQAHTRVIFYSVQGGLSGAKNGSTHESSGQSGALVTMPGVLAEEPCSAEDLIESTNRALAFQGPIYIRMQKQNVPWKLDGRRCDGFEVLSYSSSAVGTIISAGMITLETIKAQRMLVREGKIWNLINVTCLSKVLWIGDLILPGKPLLLYYNGNSRVLLVSMAEELLRVNPPPSSVGCHGFEYGTTGSIPELLRHFELDALSIMRRCIA